MAALTTGPGVRRRTRLLPPSPLPLLLPPPLPLGGIPRVTCPSTPVSLAGPPLERGALGVRSLKMAMKERLLGEDETFPREAMLGLVMIETRSSQRRLTSVSSSGGSTSCSSSSAKRKKRKSFEETEEVEEGQKEGRRGGRKERGAATTTSTFTPATTTPTPILSTTATTTKAMRVSHILVGVVFPWVAGEATATATAEMMAVVLVVVRAGHECSLFLHHRRPPPLSMLPPLLLLPRAGGGGGQTDRGRWVPRRHPPRVLEEALRMPG